MYKHFIIAFHVAAAAGLANAAAPGAETAPGRMNFKECIASSHSDANLYTVELVGGTRVEIAKDADGKPVSIRMVHASGEESLVDSVDQLLAKDAQPDVAADAPAAADAPPAARRSQVQRVLSNHVRTLLRKHCMRASQDDAVGIKPGQRSQPDPSTDWLLWPELLNTRDFWFEQAHWQVEDTFYAGMDDWSHQIADWIDEVKDKHKDLPACSAVRDDCRSTCDRVGAYAGGAVCGGLAAVAGAFSAGIGVSVGVYCGGRVLLKIEECRFNCVVPGVPCN